MNFAGKNAVITGGSSGIGKATARLLARYGANVFIIARGQKRLDAALDEIAAERNRADQVCRAFSADVAQYEQIKAVGDAIVESGYPPDILINSAGIARCNYFDELTLDDFRQTMDINFFGTVNTIKAVLPYMKERRSGHIVNISSMAGFLGVFGYTAYGASKFAVRGFSDVLRCELKPYGIHVSVVFPPDTDTPQLWAENETKPLETKMISGTVKPMSAEAVALAILRGVRRRRHLIFPGWESGFYYHLHNVLGPVFTWYFDAAVARARRQRGES
ncbi:MAG: SDR family oxidoreductase [Anaerolineae bacterium]|nr:SDR family oxidoreductase [Anaerolineae bacterium]RLC64163.1 MAG: short-chain dehydrogenase [Chloroflexota bacterium]